jgi:hypothetical protein
VKVVAKQDLKDTKVNPFEKAAGEVDRCVADPRE